MNTCISFGAVILMLAISAATCAQEKAHEKQSAGDKHAEIETVELTIHPAPAPRPALRYQLLPPYLDRIDFDAAPMYYKSLVMLNGAEGVRPTNKDWTKVLELLDARPVELPVDDSKEFLKRFHNVFDQVDIAARRTKCDWDVEIQESNENVLGILLPELASYRNLGRLLALRARVAIVSGDYGEAIRALQTGYAMSRHLAEQPFLISTLVSVAICRLMNSQLVLMASRPDAPNLYWAITVLPRPLISFERAFELESSLAYLVFPQFLAVKSDKISREQSDVALQELLSRFRSGPFFVDDGKPPLSLEEIFKQAPIAKAIELARPELIDLGYAKDAVENMPDSRVLLLYWILTIDEIRDESFKWRNVPYWQAREGMKKSEAKFSEMFKKQQRPGLPRPLLTELFSSVAAVRSNEARLQRDIELLRSIEAVRLFAADHSGELPSALSDVKDVPMPINPFTGNPFSYRVENGVGILESTAPEDESPVRYRLTLADAK